MKELKKKLEERIKLEFEILNKAENVEEKKAAMDRLTELYKLMNECEKGNTDSTFQYIKLGVELIDISAPLIFYGIWMRRGLKFEENGVLSSGVFKGLVSKFKPTK